MSKKMQQQLLAFANTKMSDLMVTYTHDLNNALADRVGRDNIIRMFYGFDKDTLRLFEATDVAFRVDKIDAAADIIFQVNSEEICPSVPVGHEGKVPLKLEISGPMLPLRNEKTITLDIIRDNLGSELADDIVSTTTAISRMAFYVRAAQFYLSKVDSEASVLNVGYSVPFLLDFMDDDDKSVMWSPLPRKGKYFHGDARRLGAEIAHNIKALKMSVGEAEKPRNKTTKYTTTVRVDFMADLPNPAFSDRQHVVLRKNIRWYA